MSKEIKSVKSVLTWRKGSEHPDKSGRFLVIWWCGYNEGVTVMKFSKKHERWNNNDEDAEPSYIEDEHVIAWANVNEATERFIVTAFGNNHIDCLLGDKTIAQDYVESAQARGRLIS